MQWSLYLLILMGQCCFFTCRLYEYHFIEENKSWYEAQRYCREKYTDLAKVFDMTDMSRLRNSAQNQGEAWIGLNNAGGNRMWHWSLPGVKYIQNDSSWNQSGRADSEAYGNCVRKRDKLADVSCNHPTWFICYDEMKKDNKTYYLIEELKNWTQAQSYCRSHYTDLASGLDQVDGEELTMMKKKRDPSNAWIGLFKDSWRWSDGNDSSFRYWDMQLFNDKQSSKTCAMTLLNRSGKWSSDECGKEKPFFCYDDKLILIKENKTWEEALNYCENNYKGLVSITNPEVQGRVQEKAKNADSPYVWIGLSYKCTLGLWLWVSDYVVCYDKWATEGKTEGCDMSVGVDRGGQHEWFSRRNNETYNFICSKQ
ncbi:putative C-type lectin domain family 20 member A [Neolamprologus brichardi]|uniref:putative C-type lectin domain family 20 member A n=1 Tax=Neolamprologus brichardi TaxID=32507 RepID=UPI001643ADF3|nr:putative C-type lectin domain family 20 member A [Neolamprologus brichardi]